MCRCMKNNLGRKLWTKSWLQRSANVPIKICFVPRSQTNELAIYPYRIMGGKLRVVNVQSAFRFSKLSPRGIDYGRSFAVKISRSAGSARPMPSIAMPSSLQVLVAGTSRRVPLSCGCQFLRDEEVDLFLQGYANEHWSHRVPKQSRGTKFVCFGVSQVEQNRTETSKGKHNFQKSQKNNC